MRYERVLVDALAARMVRDPGSLDVVVASNLFADILTDLAAAIQGGMGMAASANLAPGSDTPGLFEPVHGSAPDIAGQGVANPAGAIWSASLMLEHLGEAEAARAVMERAGGRSAGKGRARATSAVAPRPVRSATRVGGRRYRSAQDADHRAAGQHEHAREHGPTADVLASPDQDRGEQYRPQRLRRIERGDDADAAAVEPLDEARVGQAEGDAGRPERGQRPRAASPVGRGGGRSRR